MYLSCTDLNNANSSTYHYLDTTAIGPGFKAAPQVFHMTSQNLWYLIFQDGMAAYSTNTDITNPNGWTTPSHFWSDVPSVVTQNIGGGYWVRSRPNNGVLCSSELAFL